MCILSKSLKIFSVHLKVTLSGFSYLSVKADLMSAKALAEYT